jgi:GDP-mannose transporter
VRHGGTQLRLQRQRRCTHLWEHVLCRAVYLLLTHYLNPLLIPSTPSSVCCSFTSLWFISTTTPTVYSLVGSLNKVPLAFIGLFAFSTPWSIPNLLSISVGLAAGVVFAIAKSRG